MDKKLRNIVIIFFLFVIVCLCFLVEINSYLSYIIFSGITLQGIATITEFILGLSMKIGYVGPVEANDKNLSLRIVMLFVSLFLVAFGGYGMLNWI